MTDGKNVWTFFGNAGLVCHDFDGRLVWQHNLGSFDGMHGPGTSPVLCGDLVILIQDQNNQSLSVALDKTTGKARWQQDRPGAMGWCTPVALRINGRDELIYASNARLIALEPATGKELWSCSGPTREPVPSILFGHGLLYSTSGRNGPTFAVRPGGNGALSEADIVWTAARGGPHVPSPALAGELVYLINDRGILTCLDAKTGETVYQKRLDGKFSASPIVAGSYLYLSNEDGETHVIKVGHLFEEVAKNLLDEPLLASFAVQDGMIYARTPTAAMAFGTKP